MNTEIKKIVQILYSQANPKNIEGMARFGIKSSGIMLGISTSALMLLKKRIGTNHTLALDLWKTGIFEARILSAFIADPEKITKKVMNTWVHDFDNWAICDGVCIHCFRNTSFAHEFAMAWPRNKAEFVRRAGFVLMATLAVSDKKSDNAVFLDYLPILKKYSNDERNFVKKAVNWALRQIGKRNKKLNRVAIKTAKEIQKIDSSSAKWIAADALRELQHTKVQKRLKKKERNVPVV